MVIPQRDSWLSINNVVILSPNAVSFHPKSFHQSLQQLDQSLNESFNKYNHNNNNHKMVQNHVKRRTSFTSPLTPPSNNNEYTVYRRRRPVLRRDSYVAAAENGPDRLLDSISMEDKSAADGIASGARRSSAGKHQSFSGSGWDRSSKRYANKDRKIGHRRVDEAGQVTYKKIETSQICGSIQLGIGTAIASLASKPERDLLMQDFAMIETTNFVKEGSKTTPAHHYSDFKFKNYAPVAFRYFRDLFGIAPEDFLQSFCTEPLRELTNPGASGSVFYLTFDDEFIIKTVQHKEAEFLQKLLPGYYMVSVVV